MYSPLYGVNSDTVPEQSDGLRLGLVQVRTRIGQIFEVGSRRLVSTVVCMTASRHQTTSNRTTG